MWLVLTIIAVIPLAILIYLATLNGRFQIRRSLEIATPGKTVFSAVVDLKSWPEWSPWLIHEPDALISFSDDYQLEGGAYSWDGKLAGAGTVTHLSINPHRRIDQRLSFSRPFKSIGQVLWEFEEHGDRTLVTWEMSGRLPFLLRYMARRMEPVIGRDFDLGLALLNGYLDSAAPHPSITFAGTRELEDFSYWGIPCIGNLRQLEATRQASIETLTAAAAGKAGLALTLYQQFDPLASHYRAEVAIPITNSTPASNYTRREFKGGRYFQMTLDGDHRFLPLGWYALYRHCRMRRLKLDKARPALEIYHDDPAKTTDSNQVTTALYLPIR